MGLSCGVTQELCCAWAPPRFRLEILISQVWEEAWELRRFLKSPRVMCSGMVYNHSQLIAGGEGEPPVPVARSTFVIITDWKWRYCDWTLETHCYFPFQFVSLTTQAAGRQEFSTKTCQNVTLVNTEVVCKVSCMHLLGILQKEVYRDIFSLQMDSSMNFDRYMFP